jgi:Dolichyl-phosphate-mannose-protein mannosyltransferase
MRRVFLLVAWTALLWSAVVAATGGLRFSVASIEVSSRNPLNALLIACAGGVAWVLSSRGRGELLVEDARRFAAPAVACAVALAVVVIGLEYGALAAGGSDSYGYVSQADAWAAGTFRFDEPLIREFAGRVDRDVFVPLGYQAVGDAGAVVPMYAPGLPMVMAVFHRLAGREAVFYVVPLLAGVAILATYAMGARLAGQAIGAAAAALLASSPTFLFQLTAAPMSDVPVTAWWALALTLSLFNRLDAAFLSGIAVSLAILTRPNLAPLAVIPIATLAWEGLRDRGSLHRAAARAALYSAGVVPGCVAIGTLYAIWYGSPFMSGYGSLDSIYDWRNVLPNLAHYTGWMAGSQTPLVLLAFAAPWLVRRVSHAGGLGANARLVTVSWLVFIVAVLASYLPYAEFGVWWYLRFILPAFPPLLVLTAVSFVATAQRSSPWPRVLVPSALVAVMVWYGFDYARDNSVFLARSERKYAVVADYVARRLPPKAVIVSHQHSGSLRYYADRPTVRWDRIADTQLDSTVATLASSGYRPYILLESWEVPLFQGRHSAFSSLGRLDWPPMLHMRETNIRIYDPADRPASLAGRPPLTETVP